MSLVDSQNIFRKNLALLSQKIDELGLLATEGESYRTPVQAWINGLPKGSTLKAYDGNRVDTYPEPVGGVGISRSLHMKRLAKDYNFFLPDGTLITTKIDKLVELGTFWESLHPANRWGGNFEKLVDLPHFEMNI